MTRKKNMITEKSKQRVLGIVGSPRRGGNTETLVDEVLAGAAGAGALTEKVVLAELNIAPCDACDGCLEMGRCVHEDDMEALAAKMYDSQVWVLGTPVYWWGPSAQFKAFLDRWYGLERATLRGRRAILAIPLGDGSAHYARHTVGMLSDSLNYVGVDLTATIVAPGVHKPGAVRQRSEVLAAARQAGREAIEALV
jgi:multimeric flavodoxin WrbA